MTLLISLAAAITSTIIWYLKDCRNIMKVGSLSLMYWAVSLMWFVDAVIEYAELRADYFKPDISEMANDTFLGLSVVILGLIIWLVIVLIKDPKGNIRKTIKENVKREVEIK